MVLSHEDANDILQNTFVKAWLNIDFSGLKLNCIPGFTDCVK
jgi:DNA-directed RNA polymerase specialized sigma24 family protein